MWQLRGAATESDVRVEWEHETTGRSLLTRNQMQHHRRQRGGVQTAIIISQLSWSTG